MAGTFTHVCQRLDYYYVADTSKLREKLTQLFKERFPSYMYTISLKEDKIWAGYLDFLYPNEVSYEFMQNQKLVMALQRGGDKLLKKRPVDHWLYFKTEIDQNCFITYASKQGYRVVAKEKMSYPNPPFKLHISRTDKVDAASISKITIEMKKQAKRCNGEYDGWETFVVK